MTSPGTLIEYLQQKRMVCALCLRQDTKGNLFVRTEDNREDKVHPTKVLFRTPADLMPEMAPEAIAQGLKQAAEQRDRIASDVELRDLWELLSDESPDQTYGLAELAELYFGDGATPEQLSGFYRALNGDRTYFQRRGNDYRLRASEQVEEILTRLRVEQERGRERESVGRWLRRLWDGGGATPPEGFEEAATRYLTWIRDVAVHGTEAARFKDVNELLKAVGIARKDAAFRLMVCSGSWSHDENILLHRFHTPIDFSPELEAEACQAAERMGEILAEPDRLDLTELDCFTVDDEFTTEIDDALSLEVTPEGYRVGIHIADASSFVAPGGPLDTEAAVRATAIYLPRGKIRMLPEVLGDVACSLLAGEVRPAFSVLLELAHDLSLTATRMVTSRIKVRRRLTYAAADRELAGGADWSRLLDIARGLRAQRQSRGAVTVPFPRVDIRVDADGGIRLEREAPDSPAQVVVSEMMIQANRIFGEYLAEGGLPALFRGQPPPDKPIDPAGEFPPEVLYRVRKLLRRGEVGLDPARHWGLGLEAYCQASSPIRRYSDLLTQRQLKHHLRSGQPFYERDELESYSARLAQPVAQADQLERDRRAYWTLRFLEQQRWHEFEAVVLANLADKHIVQLTDVLWETDCPQVPGHPLPPGSRVRVRVELVWPRDQVVRVTPVMEDP